MQIRRELILTVSLSSGAKQTIVNQAFLKFQMESSTYNMIGYNFQTALQWLSIVYLGHFLSYRRAVQLSKKAWDVLHAL